MDKTAQDSLAKKPVDMRDRILEHLEALTSAVSLDDLARLSTSDIAETLIISRSLASQYLNDLVRAGLVVKVAGRPVRYFHRRAFQKRFQVKLSASEYASLADLIQATGIADHRDFARAVGFDLSLSSVVEQCKAAVQYPPFGLPILLSGGVGVGKSFLSRLVYEYGKNQGLLSRDSSYVRIDCAGELSVSELVSQAVSAVRGVEDHLIFGRGVTSSRSRAFERIVGAVLADAGSSYGIELSRKVAFLLAQEICLQLWPGIGLAKRKSACAEQISHLLDAVTSELPFASSVSDQVAADVEGALGISLDHFTKTLLTLCVASESRDAKALRTLCVILSHGYSTATSIADAANRMLGMHVYEAVDMPYDQQLKDIVGPLQRLVDRHSYCTGVVFLVDMGSLEEAYKALENVTDSTIGVVNNVSTGLALEIGVGLLGGKSIAEVLGDATAACVTHCKVIERINREDAIVFCSESGVDAAERIRQLVSQSLPRTIGARLLTRPFKQLVANGSNDAVFSEHRVCAVIGTGDPGVASIPFVALEDIMSTASASKVDAVFGRWLDASELSSFHEKLLSNMTLQNVIRSITILDPERLFHEIESAVHELQRRTGEKIGSNAIIGLYVHLCCLVERLVTRNPIETYVGQDRFEEERADFIESFRQSFSSISTRYRVEVPVSEIAYVFDYISVSAAPAREERLGSSDLLLDE